MSSRNTAYLFTLWRAVLQEWPFCGFLLNPHLNLELEEEDDGGKRRVE